MSFFFSQQEEEKVEKPQDLEGIWKNLNFKKQFTNINNWKLEDFTPLETVGTGTFGRVLLCSQKDSNQYFAIKTLKKLKVIQLKQTQHVIDEKDIQIQLHSPFIVQLHRTFQDQHKLYLCLEYVQGGELFTWLRKNKRFSNNITRFFIAEILLALEYMHSKGIAYRDLKPENILIDKEGHIKIADFGFAKKFQDKTWTMCGTPEYLAPEVILGTGHDKSVDYWSLGVLMFEMLSGYPPFYSKDHMELYSKICSGKFNIPTFITPEASSLIKGLIKTNKSKRLGCLKNGANDIKNHSYFAGVNWDQVAKKEIKSPINLNLDSEASTKYFMKYRDSTSVPDNSPSNQQQDLFKDF